MAKQPVAPPHSLGRLRRRRAEGKGGGRGGAARCEKQKWLLCSVENKAQVRVSTEERVLWHSEIRRLPHACYVWVCSQRVHG
jgi:hypothetical protein